MRLSPFQIDVIKRTATELFGAEARVDDGLNGGGNAPLVEMPVVPQELRRNGLTLVVHDRYATDRAMKT